MQPRHHQQAATPPPTSSHKTTNMQPHKQLNKCSRIQLSSQVYHDAMSGGGFGRKIHGAGMEGKGWERCSTTEKNPPCHQYHYTTYTARVSSYEIPCNPASFISNPSNGTVLLGLKFGMP
jgi:hypothetical protein